MNEDWVTIADLNWLAEAQILKTALESSGIEAFIPEEHISTINPGVTGVQVRVQVRASQVEDAQMLVRDTESSAKNAARNLSQSPLVPEQNMTSDLDQSSRFGSNSNSTIGGSSTCKTCGNAGVRISPIGLKGWLMFILCALVMVPMKSHQKKVCAHCGNKVSN